MFRNVQSGQRGLREEAALTLGDKARGRMTNGRALGSERGLRECGYSALPATPEPRSSEERNFVCCRRHTTVVGLVVGSHIEE